MVETMKMVASPARAAMAMRQGFTTPRVEQGWTSGVDGPFGRSQRFSVVDGGAVVVAGGDVLG